MATLVLEPKREARIKAGHPWVLRRDVRKVKGQLRDGDVAAVSDQAGRHVGMAIVNTQSRILARIYTRDHQLLDRDYLERALRRSVEYRRALLGLGPEGGVRWVFSESDGLPGLIVDQYGPCLVVQLLTLAMEQRREVILEILEALLRPGVICERSDSPSLAAEGVPEVRKIWRGELTGPVEISERGVRYAVDPMSGQKTGFFLDQRENRAFIRAYARGRRVLDAFCYTGGFAVAAAAGGATEVLGVDASAEALKLASENARRNGVADRCRFERADVFEMLRGLERKGERFDLIVLDPPAFAKNRQALRNAVRGYKEINLRALRLLNEGGLLLTCSCSQHMTEDLFSEMLAAAGADAGVRLRLVRKTFQAPDHPVLVGMPESQYLKCFWVVPLK